MPLLLTYHERPPHLRLFEWETRREIRVRRLPNTIADRVTGRDGWLTLEHNMRAVALRDSGEHSILPGKQPHPHNDPRLMWLTDPDGFATPRDCLGQAAGARIPISTGWLVAEYNGSWLERDPETGDAVFRSADGARTVLEKHLALGAFGPHVLVTKVSGGIGYQADPKILDLRDGSLRSAPNAGLGSFNFNGYVSPNRPLIVVTARLGEPPPGRPADVPIQDWVKAPRRAVDQTSVVTIFDLDANTCSVIEGFQQPESWGHVVWLADGSAFFYEYNDGQQDRIVLINGTTHVLGDTYEHSRTWGIRADVTDRPWTNGPAQ